MVTKTLSLMSKSKFIYEMHDVSMYIPSVTEEED